MNSLNSNYLDAFYQVAQTKHFTNASKRLNITQSALSQRVQNLEEALQTTLIIRSKSGVSLTQEGLILLRYCQNKFQLEQEVVNQVCNNTGYGEISGPIRIGGFSSVMRSLILPRLAPIIRDNPSVRLKMISKEIYELKELLFSGEIDYAITYEKLPNESCESIKIGEEINVLVKHKNYQGPEVYLDHDENDVITKKVLKRKMFKPTERSYLDDVYGLIDGVKNKLGYAVIPEHLIKYDKEIVFVKPKKTLKIPIYINHFKQSYYTQLHEEILKSLSQLGE